MSGTWEKAEMGGKSRVSGAYDERAKELFGEFAYLNFGKK
jgi:hypothetical protein